MSDTIDTDRYRRRLLERKAELERRLAKIEADLDATPAADVEDRASERENDEVLEGLGLSGREELRAIRVAMQRIDDGTYGTCASCKGPILPKRLDTLPFTSLCQTCARSGERRRN